MDFEEEPHSSGFDGYPKPVSRSEMILELGGTVPNCSEGHEIHIATACSWYSRAGMELTSQRLSFYCFVVESSIRQSLRWGKLPRSAAMYTIESFDQNDGKTPHAVTVKDVPVDAFWSIPVCNADGYLGANDRGVDSYNSFSPSATRTARMRSISPAALSGTWTPAPVRKS